MSLKSDMSMTTMPTVFHIFASAVWAYGWFDDDDKCHGHFAPHYHYMKTDQHVEKVTVSRNTLSVGLSLHVYTN